jgi:hypothetical protein
MKQLRKENPEMYHKNCLVMRRIPGVMKTVFQPNTEDVFEFGLGKRRA